MKTDGLQEELACRLSRGHKPTTVLDMSAQLKAMGYRLDRSMDCKHRSRIMSGPCAGQSFPAVSTGVREIDSGKTFANVDAQRDSSFKALQAIRFENSLFAVVNGHILDI
jgi:hypothetical protein